jgi:hypothetical protein
VVLDDKEDHSRIETSGEVWVYQSILNTSPKASCGRIVIMFVRRDFNSHNVDAFQESDEHCDHDNELLLINQAFI